MRERVTHDARPEAADVSNARGSPAESPIVGERRDGALCNASLARGDGPP